MASLSVIVVQFALIFQCFAVVVVQDSGIMKIDVCVLSVLDTSSLGEIRVLITLQLS